MPPLTKTYLDMKLSRVTKGMTNGQPRFQGPAPAGYHITSYGISGAISNLGVFPRTAGIDMERAFEHLRGMT